MEDLIGVLLEIFGEVLFQVVSEILIDVFSRGVPAKIQERQSIHPIPAGIMYLLVGAIAGGLSVAIFPHRIAPPNRFHGISLLISPVATGLIMSQVGRWIRRAGKKSVQIESFAYGFAFAFGMALVRFVLILLIQ
jgi:LytS/YehU family sensor histidine kinase